jgi:hypothetical protein
MYEGWLLVHILAASAGLEVLNRFARHVAGERAVAEFAQTLRQAESSPRPKSIRLFARWASRRNFGT